MAVKTDDLSDTKRKVSRVCHELYAGIEETVSREILASCAVKLCEQKCSGCSDYPDCKIYFVFFIFVVCSNHENIFTTKISRSTVHHYCGGHCWRVQEGECSKDSVSATTRYTD